MAVEKVKWDNKASYILSLIGYAVGLGNLYRFPFLVASNGGGSFLIPYFLALFLIGFPLFMLESAAGQRFRRGPMAIWKRIHPALGGIGLSSTIISSIISLYYNVILSYALFYLFRSFESPLPWQDDSEAFWHEEVIDDTDDIDDFGTIVWPLIGCLALAWTFSFFICFKGIKSSGKVVWVSATFPYLVLVILLVRGLSLPGADKGIEYFLTPKWERLGEAKVWSAAGAQIMFSLAPCWGSLTAYASHNDIRNNVLFDGIFVPIVNSFTSLLGGFCIFSALGFLAHERGVSVESIADSGLGLAFIVYPASIVEMPASNLWAILFFVMLIFLGIDSAFALTEITITSIEYFVQHRHGRDLDDDDDEADDGGNDTASSSSFDASSSSSSDASSSSSSTSAEHSSSTPSSSSSSSSASSFPSTASASTSSSSSSLVFGGRLHRKTVVAFLVCLFSFFIGFLFCTQAGVHWVELVDLNTGAACVFIIAVAECFAIAWVYGADRFLDDIRLMTGRSVSPLWGYMWKFVTPAVCVALIISTIIDMAVGETDFPTWAVLIGWLLGVGAAAPIFVEAARHWSTPAHPIPDLVIPPKETS